MIVRLESKVGRAGMGRIQRQNGFHASRWTRVRIISP